MLRDDQSFVSGTPRLILRLEGFWPSCWFPLGVSAAACRLGVVRCFVFRPGSVNVGVFGQSQDWRGCLQCGAYHDRVWSVGGVWLSLGCLSRACSGAYRTGACGLRPPPGLRPEISTRLWLHTWAAWERRLASIHSTWRKNRAVATPCVD